MLAAGTSIAAVVDSTTVRLDQPAMSTNDALQVRIGGCIGVAVGARALVEGVSVARVEGTVTPAVTAFRYKPRAAAPRIRRTPTASSCAAASPPAATSTDPIQGHDANAGKTDNASARTRPARISVTTRTSGNTHVMFDSASAASEGFQIGALNDGANVNASTLLGCYTEGTVSNFFGEYVTVVGGTNMLGGATIADVGPGLVILPKQAIPVASGSEGVDYILEAGDAETVLEGNASSGITFTIPPHAAVAFPIGTVIEVFQYGVGQITIAAGAGVTLRSDGAKVKTAAQYATIGLRQRAVDEWVLSGDLG